MGSEASHDSHQSDPANFAEFLRSYRRKPSLRSNGNYSDEQSIQQKWTYRFTIMLEQSHQSGLHQNYCSQLHQMICKVSEEHFIKPLSIIKAMNNHQVAEISSREVFKESVRVQICKRSNNVFVDIQQDIKRSKSVSPYNVVYTESLNESRMSKMRLCKSISYILVRQFNQQYHIVHCIKDGFVSIFEDKFTLQLSKHSDSREDTLHSIYEEMHNDIQFYCKLISDGCKRVYRSWVLANLNLKDDKYEKMMKEVSLLSLFATGEMYQVLFLLVRSANYTYITNTLKNLPDFIPIQEFKIRKELQIEGNFHSSQALLTKFETLTNPKYLIRALSNLKYQICNDIDSYYANYASTKKFKIDSDDLLSIIYYLLCQNRAKLLHVYCQIQILSIIYGQSINTIFEDASYMYTVIETGLQIILSREFVSNIQTNQQAHYD